MPEVNMGHSDNYNRSKGAQKTHRKAFATGIALNIAFVVVEIIYGLIANSSALLADAGHNASDVLGLAFAWAAAWMATMKPKGKYTYGLRKTTILASILNALLLVGAAVIIAWNAVEKLKNPEQVFGTQIMIVAAVGVAVNTITALLFHKGQKKDLNIRGAFLHMAADAAVTLGVLLSGFLITITGKLWIDPVTSFIIIAIILWSTWKLLIDSIDLALDAVPKNIDIKEVEAFLLEKKGVEDLHDLHIWALSTSMTALSVHLIMPDGTNDDFLAELQKELADKFGIQHTTVQTESEEISCELGC